MCRAGGRALWQGRQRENLSQVGHCERKGAGKFSATAKIIPVPETTPFLS